MADQSWPSAERTWKERAVERSLSAARDEAINRSGLLLVAARELLEETGGMDFTVQEIVDRSGLSLRSFYKHFASKDDLLLALLEEVLQQFGDELRAVVEPFDDPADQLHAYVASFYGRATTRAERARSTAVGSYHLRMLEVHREDFLRAMGPQIEVLRGVIEAGAASGRFRQDLTPREMTGLLTHTLMSIVQLQLFDVNLTGEELDVDALWRWCAASVGVDPA